MLIKSSPPIITNPNRSKFALKIENVQIEKDFDLNKKKGLDWIGQKLIESTRKSAVLLFFPPKLESR